MVRVNLYAKCWNCGYEFDHKNIEKELPIINPVFHCSCGKDSCIKVS